MNARDFKTVLEILAESGGGDLTVDELVARLLERAEGGGGICARLARSTEFSRSSSQSKNQGR